MKIKVGCFAIMLFLALFISHSYFALASLAAIILHECGHIFAAKTMKIKMSECKIDIFGAALTPLSNDFSYKDEIFLCICGPAANILTALAVFPYCLFTQNKVTLYFILASFSLALLNLIPIKGFDGGRIFFSLLCLLSDIDVAEKVLSAVSFICILILWIMSVYFLLMARSNLSLFVFSISLFVKIFLKENKTGVI